MPSLPTTILSFIYLCGIFSKPNPYQRLLVPVLKQYSYQVSVQSPSSRLQDNNTTVRVNKIYIGFTDKVCEGISKQPRFVIQEAYSKFHCLMENVTEIIQTSVELAITITGLSYSGSCCHTRQGSIRVPGKVPEM